ncbi:hypothetical protein V1477_010106 [Vespula maculifrons]|uniref:Uncharacterized protein n=2 Tax=Vespula TaxID=7451 RepID=A0A834JZ08_VESVU|nr:hypothetical protein HZH66_007622 [Vespula vulgaris]
MVEDRAVLWRNIFDGVSNPPTSPLEKTLAFMVDNGFVWIIEMISLRPRLTFPLCNARHAAKIAERRLREGKEYRGSVRSIFEAARSKRRYRYPPVNSPRWMFALRLILHGKRGLGAVSITTAPSDTALWSNIVGCCLGNNRVVGARPTLRPSQIPLSLSD